MVIPWGRRARAAFARHIWLILELSTYFIFYPSVLIQFTLIFAALSATQLPMQCVYRLRCRVIEVRQR